MDNYADNPQFILVTGVRAPTALDDYFGSQMVDVAAVTEITCDAVKIVGEPDINLDDPEDRDWLVGLVRDALAECGEDQIDLRVVTPTQPA